MEGQGGQFFHLDKTKFDSQFDRGLGHAYGQVLQCNIYHKSELGWVYLAYILSLVILLKLI